VKLLLTGEPHSGKTTLLEGFIENVPYESQGFVTREALGADGVRTGFELVSSLGQTATLASVDSTSEVRVSRYGVEVEQLDGFLGGLPAVEPGKLLYIDEIGRMELFSSRFKDLVTGWLDSENHYVGTVACNYQDSFIDQVLARADSVLLSITPENRAQVKDVLDNLALNLPLLDRLAPDVQTGLTTMAKEYTANRQLIQLKKLFRNALKYLAEGRVIQEDDGIFLVGGNTANHRVTPSGHEWGCDCDLFNGRGDYAGNAGECSHIQVARVVRKPTET
jgi:nucleoside-triphosphatase